MVASQQMWVECGRIGRAVGLRGEVSVRWNSGSCPVDVGGELFLAPVDEGGEYRSMQMAALREQGRLSVARFVGVDGREKAESLRGAELFLPANRLPALAAGEHYSYQILGCDVVTEAGQLLGRVVRIFAAGGSDVYEVRAEGARPGDEILIPAIDDVVRSIDIATKKIVVRLLDGMLDT